MNYTSASLAYYLNNIKNFPVLTKEEEKELASRVKKGDKKAMQKLVVCNLKFVVMVAKKYTNSGIPLVDLISEGNLGLIKASENFDGSRGFHFISYAVHWIKQSIIKAIAEKSKIVKLPLSWNNDLYSINKELGVGNDRSNEGNKVKQLSEKLGIKKEKIQNLLELSKNHLSLQAQISYRDNEKTDLVNTIKDNSIVNPENNLMNKNIQADILKALGHLNDVEKKVIIDRFGIGTDEKPKKLIKIGNELNLTKERIRQIEKKALEKLKEYSKKLEINNYLKV